MALTAPFLLEELDRIVSWCDGNKISGPDGFNFSLFKRFWSAMRGDIGIIFDEFHQFSLFPQCVASYFMTLIPKRNKPFMVINFWPISLTYSLYK